MSLFALPLAALPLLAGGDSLSGARLELRSSKPELLVAEPYDLRLAVVNEGTRPIAVARHFFELDIILSSESGMIECEGSSFRGTPGAPKVTWESIAPGTEYAIALPAFQCFCKESSCEDWLYRPSRYVFRVRVDHRPSDVASSNVPPTPTEALNTALESNSLEIRVKEPTGVDAQALAWAKSLGETPLSLNVAKKFPSSTYAALLLASKIYLPRVEPHEVKKLIDDGRFPDWNSVPDPASPDGWTSHSGADMVRWQVEQAERILREHPDFSQAGQLRLAIGVGSLRLGEKQRGLAVLRDLAAEPERAEGAWARTFLSLGP